MCNVENATRVQKDTHILYKSGYTTDIEAPQKLQGCQHFMKQSLNVYEGSHNALHMFKLLSGACSTRRRADTGQQHSPGISLHPHCNSRTLKVCAY